MGNSQERQNCDTLAREITFKQFTTPEKPLRQHVSKCKRESMMHRSKEEAVYRMPVRIGSRSRPSLKNRGTGSKSPAAQRANRILLTDMELECDGSVCRLVPRESLKRKVNPDQKQSAKAKRLARERPNARSKSGNLNPLHITDATAKLASLEIPLNKGVKSTSNPATEYSQPDTQNSASIDVIGLPEGLLVQKASQNIQIPTLQNNNNNGVIKKAVAKPVKPKVTDIWKTIESKGDNKASDDALHCKLNRLMINQKVTEL